MEDYWGKLQTSYRFCCRVCGAEDERIGNKNDAIRWAKSLGWSYHRRYWFCPDCKP